MAAHEALHSAAIACCMRKPAPKQPGHNNKSSWIVLGHVNVCVCRRGVQSDGNDMAADVTRRLAAAQDAMADLANHVHVDNMRMLGSFLPQLDISSSGGTCGAAQAPWEGNMHLSQGDKHAAAGTEVFQPLVTIMEKPAEDDGDIARQHDASNQADHHTSAVLKKPSTARELPLFMPLREATNTPVDSPLRRRGQTPSGGISSSASDLQPPLKAALEAASLPAAGKLQDLTGLWDNET